MTRRRQRRSDALAGRRQGIALLALASAVLGCSSSRTGVGVPVDGGQAGSTAGAAGGGPGGTGGTGDGAATTGGAAGSVVAGAGGDAAVGGSAGADAGLAGSAGVDAGAGGSAGADGGVGGGSGASGSGAVGGVGGAGGSAGSGGAGGSVGGAGGVGGSAGTGGVGGVGGSAGLGGAGGAGGSAGTAGVGGTAGTGGAGGVGGSAGSGGSGGSGGTGGACGDTTSDPQHCGACGHSCGGGACVAGVCQALVLAPSQSTPEDLAVEADGVYFTNRGTSAASYSDGSVNRVPLDGGAVTALATGQARAKGIALDASSVYFVLNDTVNGMVAKVPRAGGSVTTLVWPLADPGYVAVDGSSAYFSVGINASTGSIQRVPLGGGSPSPVALGQGWPRAIVVDATNAYWVNSAGSVRFVAKTGGVPTTFTTGQNPSRLAIDAASIYWANFDGEIVTAPIAGGATTVLGRVPGGGRAVAVDGADVYWTVDSGDGQLLQTPKGGGSTRVVFGGLGVITALVQDAGFLYFIAAQGIRKIAKPVPRCGDPGNPCCAGSSCTAGAECVSGTCQECGGQGQACCGSGCWSGTCNAGTCSGASAGCATQLDTGWRSACAVKTGGQVVCWGSAGRGSLGTGAPVEVTATPVPMTGLGPATKVSIASNSISGSACAVLTSGGSVRCWGANNFGQLANPANTPPNPTPLATTLSGALDVSLGANSGHGCAIWGTGSVSCFGHNRDGQLGSSVNSGSDTPNPTPTQVMGTGINGLTVVSAGGSHTCVRRSTGDVYCWGDNYYGQLTGSSTTLPQPVPRLALSGAATVSAGNNHTCAIVSGTVRCWGRNYDGQLGVAAGAGSAAPNGTPVTVTGLASVTAVSAGDDHTCAVTGGAVWCWGTNRGGQLGNTTNLGVSTPNTTPTQVAGLSGVATVSSGGLHTCALKTDGTVWCWGMNLLGELGTGTQGPLSTSPVQVHLTCP